LTHWSLDACGSLLDEARSISWTREQLAEQVELTAVKLRGLNVEARDSVAIVHGNSAAFVADLLAVWSCDATAVLLDPTSAAAEQDNLLRFFDPRVVLGEAGTARAYRGDRTDDAAGRSADAGNADPLAIILVTSGTTGMPKAVGLSHRALQARVACNREAIGDAAMARSLVTLATSFGHGLIGNVLTPLFAGGDVVFPARRATLARDLGTLIDTHGITFLTGVPALWRMALKMSGPPAGGSLRRVHVGSAPLSEQLWRDIIAWTGSETVNCYGMTEVANWFAGASSRDNVPRSGLVGRPWGGRAAVLDSSGQISASGVGEILVHSPSMMQGYLDRPDLTQQCRIADWYRTGDLGIIEDDGQILLQGRLKDEINRAGTKIQPTELDMLIESHPAVEEACAFAMPDPAAGEIVAAAIRLKDGMNASGESLALWCGQQIRRAAVPERWYFVSELPRTPRGKMRREEVYAMLAGGKT
jgi:acyl-CoA synthetase (AMP-forming)/AMP-acid ligase II